MRCPNCGKEGCKYLESRKKYWGGRHGKTTGFTRAGRKPRTNFKVKCSKCGFSGEIK